MSGRARAHHPRIKLWQFKMGGLRQCHLVEGLFAGKNLRDFERRIALESEVEAGDIEPLQINPVVEAMIIRLLFVERVIPSLESVAQHQVQFQMQMCASLI